MRIASMGRITKRISPRWGFVHDDTMQRIWERAVLFPRHWISRLSSLVAAIFQESRNCSCRGDRHCVAACEQQQFGVEIFAKHGFPKLRCRRFGLISEILRYVFELLAFGFHRCSTRHVELQGRYSRLNRDVTVENCAIAMIKVSHISSIIPCDLRPE